MLPLKGSVVQTELHALSFTSSAAIGKSQCFSVPPFFLTLKQGSEAQHLKGSSIFKTLSS